MSHCPRCGNLEYAVEREIDRRLKSIEESQERILHELHELRHPNRSFPTSICFKEITMNPTIGGNTQVFTGVLAPSGATYPADTVFAVTSNDPAVVPTVDATGLIVTGALPAGWVESTTTPLAYAYTATSASGSLSATITPSAPPVTFPTGIAFAQTQ